MMIVEESMRAQLLMYRQIYVYNIYFFFYC